MIRNVFVAAIAAAATIVFAGSTASADEQQDPRAGTRGHVTAYEADKKTVIDVDPCPRWSRYTWDYTTCSARFRVKINETICHEKGRGRHDWYFQIGQSLLMHNTTRCD